MGYLCHSMKCIVKCIKPGVFDDGISEVCAAGLNDLKANIIYGAVVEADMAES